MSTYKHCKRCGFRAEAGQPEEKENSYTALLFNRTHYKFHKEKMLIIKRFPRLEQFADSGIEIWNKELQKCYDNEE